MKISEYAPGAPCWADLMTTDLDSAKSFYARLLGWDPQTTGDPTFGGYTICHVGEEAVAGLGQSMTPNQPPAWMVYFATTDADAVASKIESAGGRVLAAPMEVAETGRMAVFQDPTGAAFGVWQALQFKGAGLLEEPGAISWVELMTRDTAGAKDFYGQVFGWATQATDVGVPYMLFQSGDRSVAGMMAMAGNDWPAELPAHWMIYFEVTDTDDVAARTVDLGGQASVPPTDIAPGRFAVLNDPQGAAFSIVKTNPDWMMYG